MGIRPCGADIARREVDIKESMADIERRVDPSRATIGICIAQTKGIESIDSRHRGRRVDINAAYFAFIKYGNCFEYINAIHLLYLHLCILYLHHVRKELYSTEPFVFIFYQAVPCNIYKAIVIYCSAIFSNIDLAQLSHHLSNNDMGIKDFYGILFETVIHLCSEVLHLTIILPLFSAFVLISSQFYYIDFLR